MLLSALALALPPPAPLEPLHPVGVRDCRSSSLLRGGCPRLALAGVYRRSGIFVAHGRDFGAAYDVFSAEALPRRGDRPSTRHLVVYAGRRLPFAEAERQRPVGIRNGLTRRGPLAEPRLLARVTWGGRRGDLVLWRPYPNGGMDGNHLVFRWRDGGVERALTLHEWEPLTEAAATLRAIVESLPRPRARPPRPHDAK